PHTAFFSRGAPMRNRRTVSIALVVHTPPGRDGSFPRSSRTRHVRQDAEVKGVSTTVGMHARQFLLLSGLVPLLAGNALAQTVQPLDLGTFGGSNSQASSVSDLGQVFGYSQTTGDAEAHAFVWTQIDGMRDLGTLGGSFSVAVMANASGTI